MIAIVLTGRRASPGAGSEARKDACAQWPTARAARRLRVLLAVQGLVEITADTSTLGKVLKVLENSK